MARTLGVKERPAFEVKCCLLALYLSVCLQEVPLEVVDVYPSPRHEAPHPGGHVVSVDDDDLDLDTGGKATWIGPTRLL